MNRLFKILGSRSAGVICLLFAIANRIVFTSLYSLVGADTKLQLTYAKNFLAGKGMGATKYFTTDPNNPVFDTQQIFPPGFSFTIIPFLKITGGDEYKAVVIFDIIVAVLFVFAVRIVGKKAGLSAVLNNIMTLVAGCSQYFFFMSWSSTDAIGVCLVLFGLAKTIDIITKDESPGIFGILGFSLLFCLPFFFRYMYLPVALLLPFLVLLSGFFFANRNLKSTGIKLLVSSSLLLASFFIVSTLTAGNALYVTDVGRGFFPGQFTEWYPFLPASFINIDFGAQLVQTALGVEYSAVISILKIINAVFTTILIIVLFKYVFPLNKNLPSSFSSLFIIIGSAISLSILLLLAYLTLTYKELSWGFYKWTHVQDPRYFAFLYVFVPLLFFVCINQFTHFFKRLPTRIITIVLLICMATELLHGVYYNFKILSFHKDLAYIRNADKGFRSFPTIITEIKKKNPGQEIIVCSPDHFYLHTASQMGYKAIFDYDNYLLSGLKPSAKSLLLMPINTKDVIIIKDYLEKNKPQLIATAGETSFYLEELNPQ